MIMKSRITSSVFYICLLSLLCSVGTVADTLVAEKSGIRFVSVKNASVAEVHHFRSLSGSLSEEGRVTVTIALVDVETMIPIRNERMREMFFETVSFPVAVIEADIDMAAINALASGDYLTMEVLFRLSLHGKEQMLAARVGVARLGEELHVNTLQPLIINTSSFGLTEGVQRLLEVAGLHSISTAVPVTANLVFAPGRHP
jgi:hypothetical protein